MDTNDARTVKGIVINRSIPIPRKSDKWPWAELEIGESFELTDVTYGSARSMAYSAGLRLQRRFLLRRTEGTIRVWRIT